MSETQPLLNDQQWNTMLETLALGAPVLAVGPGCQRVGFDNVKANASPWRQLTNRARLVYAGLEDPAQQVFLRRFWESKLSDETQEEYRGKTIDEELDLALGDVTPSGPIDRLRTQIAVDLVCALVDCTRYLGGVVATGMTPVSSWNLVSDREDAATDEEPSVTDGPRAGEELRESAAKALERVAGAASAMWTWTRDPSLGSQHAQWLESPLAEALAKPPSELPSELPVFLKLVNVGAIGDTTSFLVKRCLRSSDLPLSGAIIEWLADLLWHVLTCDSAVPPSQSELAFHMNLRQTAPQQSTFRRSRPGEYRGEASDLSDGHRDRDEMTSKITARMAQYDAGYGDDEWDWENDERIRLTRTIAATLAVCWDHRLRQLKKQDSAPPPHPIALVSSYDLMLERQLLEISGVGEAFHVVVPVWTDTGTQTELAWLWGTYTKQRGFFKPERLRSHEGGSLQWHWFDRENYGDAGEGSVKSPEVRGPIVVKINGSPLMRLSTTAEPAEPHQLGLRPMDNRDDETLEPATIFSEYDSLASIITLAGRSNEGLSASVASALSWESRGWVFLGDSFPDWIPRLRLLFSAKELLGTRGRGRKRGPRSTSIRTKIAVDRAFDWPELAILDALKVQPFAGNLAQLSQYPKAITTDERLQDFLADVEKKQGDMR